MSTLHHFPSRLRQLRLLHHLTQADLGSVLGYGYTAISNYESGRNEPSLDDLIRLAHYFSLSVEELIGAEPPSDPSASLSRPDFPCTACGMLSAKDRAALKYIIGRLSGIGKTPVV